MWTRMFDIRKTIHSQFFEDNRYLRFCFFSRKKRGIPGLQSTSFDTLFLCLILLIWCIVHYDMNAYLCFVGFVLICLTLLSNFNVKLSEVPLTSWHGCRITCQSFGWIYLRTQALNWVKDCLISVIAKGLVVARIRHDIGTLFAILSSAPENVNNQPAFSLRSF